MLNDGISLKNARVYAYTRVSTAIQVEGYSLDAQKKEIEDFADRWGMHIMGYYSDEGKSGKDIKGRPGFQQMMDDIASRKDDVNFVVVWKLSRFGRNAADTLSSVKKMKLYGVHLYAIQENLDSSVSTGKIILAVLSAMAEAERENILAQTQSGRIEKASRGLYNGGLCPYGYNLDSKKEKLVVVPEEAEIVKLIFDKYANTDYGPSGVAEMLNNMGYKKVAKREHENDFFTRAFILRVIKNPVYLGHVAYGKTTTKAKDDDPESSVRIEVDDYILTKNVHEPIVSQEVWDAAQKKRISMQGKKEKKEEDHEYILSGLLKCPLCGRTLYGAPMRNGKKRKDGTPYPVYYAYACRPSISSRKKDGNCSFGQISAHKIDEPIRDIILKLVNSETFGQRMVELADEQLSVSEVQKEIQGIEEQLRNLHRTQRELEDRRNRINFKDKHWQRKLDSYETALDEIYDDMSRLEDALEDKEKILESIKRQGLSRESIYEGLRIFAKIYDTASDYDKKQFMQSFIKSIELYPEKSRREGCMIKTIHFSFPVSYDGKAVYGVHYDRPVDGEISPGHLMTAESVVTLIREEK